MDTRFPSLFYVSISLCHCVIKKQQQYIPGMHGKLLFYGRIKIGFIFETDLHWKKHGTFHFYGSILFVMAMFACAFGFIRCFLHGEEERSVLFDLAWSELGGRDQPLRDL